MPECNFEIAANNHDRVIQGLGRGLAQPARERACVLRLARDHLASLERPATLLEVGAGAGFYSRALARPSLSARVSDPGRRGTSRLEGSERFDLVLVTGLLEFLSDPEGSFLALCDRVGPGGKLVAAVPRSGLLGSIYWLGRRASDGVTMKLFSSAWLEDLANDCGLSLEGARYPIPHRMVIAFERLSLS
jgi:hypothetical protein